MNKEFDKLKLEFPNLDVGSFDLGWIAARDKILEILEANIQPGYHEEPGGRIGFDVREIPWPYADRVIEQIKNLCKPQNESARLSI